MLVYIVVIILALVNVSILVDSLYETCATELPTESD